MRAALIYQHATAERDAAIATALSRLATESSPPQGPAPAADRPRAPPNFQEAEGDQAPGL